MAIAAFLAFALAEAAYSSAVSAGTPPPSWFLGIVIALGALTVVGIVVATVDSALLRRRPLAVRAQAAQLAAQHRSRPHARHHPPRHRVLWTLRLVGTLLMMVVAVVSVPAVVDGVAYLAGAEKTVTFDPVSYQTNCDQNGCQTSTSGILETGGAGIQSTWPDEVPLGKPFAVHEPLWRWGIGGALINSDGIAVTAVVVSLLIEVVAAFLVILFVRMMRNWLRRRRYLQATEAG